VRISFIQNARFLILFCLYLLLSLLAFPMSVRQNMSVRHLDSPTASSSTGTSATTSLLLSMLIVSTPCLTQDLPYCCNPDSILKTNIHRPSISRRVRSMIASVSRPPEVHSITFGCSLSAFLACLPRQELAVLTFSVGGAWSGGSRWSTSGFCFSKSIDPS